MNDAAPTADELRPLYAEHVAWLAREYGRLLADAGYDAVVLHAGSPKSRSTFDDQDWPLRVTPHFSHWLPLAHADCALVVRPGARPRLVWAKSTSFWEQPAAPELDHWVGSFDVVEVAGARAVKEHVPTGERVAFIGEGHLAFDWGFEPAALNPTPLATRLDRLRIHKTPYEVRCIAEANRRAALGHRAVAAAFRDGDRSELDLHLVFLGASGQDDPETPYKNIVATGAHAATLHHVSYGRRAEPRPSLLLDAGATFLGYASDITRTYVKGGGAAESAFGHLLHGMERMQQRLVERAAVGRPYEELHDESHRELAGVLREVGVLRGGVDEATEAGLTRAFYPHGLGHSLGLQTHDVGCAEVKPRADNPFLRNTTRIATGQVFTIEPGIYFIPGLLEPVRQGAHAGAVDWRLVDALTPLGGIRIEDDVLVTGDARPRNLTREVLPS